MASLYILASSIVKAIIMQGNIELQYVGHFHTINQVIVIRMLDNVDEQTCKS